MAIPVLPEKFLNLKMLAAMEAVLAAMCIIFQIVSLAESSLDHVGVGIWGGLLVLLTAACTFQLVTKGGDGWLLGLAHLLAGQSILIGFLLFGLEAYNIDWINRYNYCGIYWGNTFCSTVLAMSVLLMLLGIAIFFVSLVLAYALIKHFISGMNASPPSSAPPS